MGECVVVAVIFDTRGYVRRLREGGVGEGQADAQAEALHGALREGVATSAGLLAVEAKMTVLQGRLESLESKVDTLRWLVVAGLGLLAVWIPVVVFAAQIFLG